MRKEYTRSIEPARALAAETVKLERSFKAECRMQSDLSCDCYSLTLAEIELMWQTVPPRIPIPPPG